MRRFYLGFLKEGFSSGGNPLTTGRRVGNFIRKSIPKPGAVGRISDRLASREEKKSGINDRNIRKGAKLTFARGIEDTRDIKEGETTGGDPEATGRRVGKALKRAPAKRTGGMLKKAAKIQSRLEVRRMRKGFPTKGEFNKGLLSGVDENETPEEKAQGEKEVREVLHSLARKDRGRTLLANRKSSEMATKHNKEDRITKILKDKRKLKTENKALYIGFLLDEGKESQLKDTKEKKEKISSISEDESSYNQSNLVKIPYLDWLYEDLSKGYSNTKGIKKLTKIKKVKKAV